MFSARGLSTGAALSAGVFLATLLPIAARAQSSGCASEADRQYVAALYQSALVRDPETSYWCQVLRQSGRTTVADGIERSFEAHQNLVRSWYRLYLMREGDAAGVDYWSRMLTTGNSEEQVLSGILATPEYFHFVAPTVTGMGGSPSNRMFVTALYLQLLQRQPDAGGLDYWAGQVPALGRNGVAAMFLRTGEYRGIYVRSLYVKLLGRSATQAELNAGVNGNADLTQLRVALKASQEFYDRVSPQSDLEVFLSSTSDAMRGALVVYDVYVIDRGPTAAQNVEVTLSATSDFTFNAAKSSPTCTSNGQTVRCTGAVSTDTPYRVPYAKIVFETTNADCNLWHYSIVNVRATTIDPNASNDSSTHAMLIHC